MYLAARGTAVIRIEQQSIALNPGDMLVVEPGEAHKFLSSSPDYFHFVMHTPGLVGAGVRKEKTGAMQTAVF